MRVLSVLVAAAITSSSAAAPPARPIPAKPADCPATSRVDAAQRDGRVLFNRLGDLPPADAYRTVLRHDGRCEAPLILRHDIGARRH